MDEKLKKPLAEKEKDEYWAKKKHILSQEEHDEFMKKTGMSKEEHDAWHKQHGVKKDSSCCCCCKKDCYSKE